MDWFSAKEYCEKLGSRLTELKPHPAWHNRLAENFVWPNRASK